MIVTRFRTIATVLGVSALGGVAWVSTPVHGQEPQARLAALAEVHAGGLHDAPCVASTGALLDASDAARDEASFAADQEDNVTRMLSVLDGRGSRLGVSIRDVNDDEAKAGKTTGVVIETVTDESPAAKGGLKAGDLVTSFDGERVRSARQFSRLVEETPSGRSVKAQVMRDGAALDLTLTPQAPEPMRLGHMGGDALPRGNFEWRSDESAPRFHFRNDGPMLRMMPGMPAMPAIPGMGNLDVEVRMGRGRLGVGVQDLTPELAEYFGVKEGVLVTSVQKDGPAAKAGVKAGDVITTVDGTSIDDAAELRRRVWKDGKASDLTLGVSRDKKDQTLKVQLPADESGDIKLDDEKVKIEKKIIKRKV